MDRICHACGKLVTTNNKDEFPFVCNTCWYDQQHHGCCQECGRYRPVDKNGHCEHCVVRYRHNQIETPAEVTCPHCKNQLRRGQPCQQLPCQQADAKQLQVLQNDVQLYRFLCAQASAGNYNDDIRVTTVAGYRDVLACSSITKTDLWDFIFSLLDQINRLRQAKIEEHLNAPPAPITVSVSAEEFLRLQSLIKNKQPVDMVKTS